MSLFDLGVQTPKTKPVAPPPPTMTHVMTTPQVAKMAGWSRRRMYRHLMHHNRKMGGQLLFDASLGKSRPIWTVSVAALKNLAPQWFNDPEHIQQEFAFLHAAVENANDTAMEQGEEIRILKAQVKMLIERLAG